jgi:hypothetical protein
MRAVRQVDGQEYAELPRRKIGTIAPDKGDNRVP